VRRALLAALAVLLLALAGCTAVPQGPLPRTSSPAAEPEAVLVAFVGDSLTVGFSPDFSGGDFDPGSWVHQVLDDRFRFAGGWAVWGATTDQMRDGVSRLDADVLVILAGTNDVALGIPFETTTDNLEAIARTVAARQVVVSAIPPLDGLPDAPAEFNARLERFAADRGWAWVPPVPELGTDGRFAEGMTQDGVHLTPEGARLLGRAIREVLTEVAP
jgi:lysophospholipase L1-like esterase